MTVPNGAAGIDSANGTYLVSAYGHSDLSAADLVGNDQATVRANYASKFVMNGTSVFSDPTGPLAQLFGAIPGGAFGLAIIQYLVGLVITIVGPIPIIGTAFEDLANFLGLTHTTATTAATAMAVAFDAASHGEVHTGNPTSKTVPHTAAVTANGAMVAYVAVGPLTPQAYAKGFVTAKYNGADLESQGGIDCGHGTNGWLEQFTLLGPASGLHNLVVTAASPVHSIIVDVVTYTGCSGFSGFMSAATNSVKQDAVVRGSTNGMVSVGMASAAAIAGITGATQRSLQNVDTATTAGNLIVGDAPGADSVTVTATR